MGFASAFASGLVKGFNQNIIREQEARAKEEAKLDGYEAMIFKTAMEGGDDVNTSAINRISELVKGGRKQLEEQGGIDIFGRPGKRLKLDMLNTAGIVNNTNSTVLIGSVRMPVLKAYNEKTIRGTPSKRASVFFDSLDRLGPDGVNKLFKTKEDRLALSQFYKNNVSNFLRPLVIGQNDKIVQTLDADHVGVNAWMKKIVTEQKSKYQYAIEGLKGNGKYTEGEFILPFNKMEGVVTSFEKMNFNKKDISSLRSLAKLHNFDDAGEFVYTAAGEYDTPQKFMSGLKTTIKLYNMNAHDPKSIAEMRAIGAYFVEEKLDKDPVRMANILAPLVVNSDYKLLDGLRAAGFTQALDGSDFKSQFEKFSGVKLSDFDDNYKALTRSEGQLKQLMALTKGANLASGTVQAGIFKFFDNIFSPTGGIDQVKSLVGTGKDDANSSNIASRIQNTLEKIDQSTAEGKLQARITTLKFVLAADLARAEDSNGRLSDQDLARNMAKLGQGQSTIDNQIAAMREVMGDVQNKRLNLFNLNKIRNQADRRGYFTRKERTILAADKMGRNYIDEYNLSSTTRSVPPPVTATIEEVMNPEIFDPADSSLQGSGGESVHKSKDGTKYVLVRDGQIIEQIPAEDVEKAQQDGKISFITVGEADQKKVGNVSDIKGEYSPFGPDANPNVSQGNVGNNQSSNNNPPINKPNSVSPVTTIVSGSSIGINSRSDLPPKNADGTYTIGGAIYELADPAQLTFKKL